MKEITIPVLWAATEYYLGPLLWVGLGLVLAAVAMWLIVVRRTGSLAGAIAQVRAPVVALAALAAVAVTMSIPALTRSEWAYVAGAADYAVLIGAGAAAAAGVAFLLTPLLLLMQARRV